MVADKKLNSEQIQSLYAFTRQHFVEWYDLQTELVDHLANAIEAQWQQHPNRTFDEALQLEFKKFGVFGFQDVIVRKKQALHKVYHKLVWKFVKESFSIPMLIFITAIIFFLTRLFTATLYGQYFYFGFIFLVLIFLIIANIKLEKIKELRKLKQKRKYLLEDVIYKGGNYVFVCVAIAPQLLIKLNAFDNIYIQFTVSIIDALIFMFSNAILFIIPNKAEEYLIETYPEYKLS